MKQLNYALSLLMAVFMLSFSSLQAQYCDGPINVFDDEWITNVSFANVDNTTAFSQSTANTINGVANVTTGEMVDFSVDVTTDGGPWNEAVVIYFDFDNDFIFETELDMGTISITNSTATYDAGSAPGGNTMMMPASAGTYRMRVVLDFGGPVPGPCDADNGSGFKDSEDYEIIVTGGGGGPTCDDGMQNGDETGVDCGGASCPPCDMGGGGGDEPVCYDLTITFDNFPEETSWEIADLEGNVLDGINYDDVDPLPADGSTVVEEFCLDEGCYEFTIFDAFGDGICCGFGAGSYSLEDEDGNVVASGGSFGTEESTFFCTDPSLCTPPSATATTWTGNNCDFWVLVTVSDLGTASTVVIDNDEGAFVHQNVFLPRTYYVGPFSGGDNPTISIYDSANPACGIDLGPYSSGCSFGAPVNTGSEVSTFGAFPNPTTGDLNVVVSEFIGKNANVEIYNAVGQLIESRELVDIQSSTERFDLSAQQAGVYMINVNVEGVGVFTERVMLSARP